MSNPKLPQEAFREIETAIRIWRSSDSARWNFALIAHNIVGKYIPYATELLAKGIGLDVSSVQGYAKAHATKMALKDIGHKAPLENLYISHYIVCGKALFSKDSQWDIQQINELLQEANRWGKPVSWLRSKIGNVSEEDSYLNSTSKTIADLEAHIINAPCYGVPEYKAVIASKVARVLVRVLRWIQSGEEYDSPEIIEREVGVFVEIAQKLFPERQEELSHE